VHSGDSAKGLQVIDVPESEPFVVHYPPVPTTVCKGKRSPVGLRNVRSVGNSYHLWCCRHDQSHCESLLSSFDEYRLSPPALRPSQLSAPVNGCYRPHPPSPFVIITQPKSWYSFYHPTEGGRLSRLRHCSKGVQPVPKAVYHSGCRDKHNCLQ